MARQKDNVHIRRVACALSEENYRRVKAFSRVAGKDVGFVVRSIIDNYIKKELLNLLKDINIKIIMISKNFNEELIKRINDVIQ